MSQISRRWIKPEVESKIQNLLVECIIRCSNQNQAANFIDVLLTRTEKTMIAKRIAIALMLIKGYTTVEINEKLKVSLTTVYMVKAWLDIKGTEYKKILEDIAKKDQKQEEEYQNRVTEAESFFSLRPGVNWKSLRKGQWEKAKEAKVPF